jgi:hypothetical protein
MIYNGKIFRASGPFPGVIFLILLDIAAAVAVFCLLAWLWSWLWEVFCVNALSLPPVTFSQACAAMGLIIVPVALAIHRTKKD